MSKTITTISLLLSLFCVSACTSKPEAYSATLDKITLASQQADNSCSTDKQTEADKVSCTKELVLKTAAEDGFDDIFVLEKHFSLNEGLAKKLDARQLKAEEYNKQKAELADQTVSFFYAKLNRLRLEEIERKQNATMAWMAMSQGMNSMSNSYNNSAAVYGAAAQQPWTPSYRTPRMITTNCNTFGNNLTCYSQ